MVAAPLNSYSPYLDHPAGTSGSGLDQTLGWIATDPGLAGANEASSIRGGIAAANALNGLLVEGLQATGSLNKAVLLAQDIVALNAWIRDPAHPERLARFVADHGDDEGNAETGFHLIQNDGGNRTFDGKALIDTVLDGLYHIGFPLNANGTRLTNEDGDDNALLTDVARWLTALKVDLASSGTGFDRVVETIVGDPGLQASIPWADIRGGAEAANDLNGLILQGIQELNTAGAADADNTRLSGEEVIWLNKWIRSDAGRYAFFVNRHGDDENGSETGYHLVQNDGATTTMFGLNAVNTVFDGLYHIGFRINNNLRFENEDGDANARVEDVAEWISYYYGDPSTTGTGLDRMVDWIKLDPGLPRWTSALDINDGLAAADSLNHLFLDALEATGVNQDGWISRNDLRVVNRWVRENVYDDFVVLHGDDENGEETGFHLIQNDGASTNFFSQNLVNTVVDGIYHYGFEIRGENFLNEDGNNNQSLSDVSGWLNYFLSGRRLSIGTWGGDGFVGNAEAEQVLAYGGDDRIDGQGGSDLLDGSWGNDTLLGGEGEDLLDGGFGDDLLDGGEGGDTYLVSGADSNHADWQTYSFAGFDVYADSGSSGQDVILAEGVDTVDIGLCSFNPNSGIETIVNATESQGLVRLLGNWENNTLDFSETELKGGDFLIDAGWGNDTVIGSSAADRIRGGGGDDWLDGGQGGDSFLVRGANPNWVEGQPYAFEGFDLYQDSGTDGVDAIEAEGEGSVDVGLRGFSSSNGIERIVNRTTVPGEPLGVTAEVRLLDTWESNLLDFSAIEVEGGNVLIDAGGGQDTVIGTSQVDVIRGGGDSDVLDGGDAGDVYLATGSNPDWVEGQPYTFEGFDVYADTGSYGVDQIIAVGSEPVDIGFRSFGPGSGIEEIVNNTQAPLEDGDFATCLVRILGSWEDNSLDFSATTFLGWEMIIDGAGGSDTIVGSADEDSIRGGAGSDRLDGGGGGDVFLVSGHNPGNPNWETYDFEGHDTYVDTGAADDGVDVIVAEGLGPVDIGLQVFHANSGIEQIRNATQVDDGNGGITYAQVTLLGNWQDNVLDFSNVALIGSHFLIAGDGGHDTITGTSGGDRISGDGGDDLLRGGAGDDRYEVSGSDPNNSNWHTYSFAGYDTYADSSGVDTIVAMSATGVEAVDIGLRIFQPANGIECIDATGTSGRVRLLADWQDNTLDFSATELRGTNLIIASGWGNDNIVGSTAADRLFAEGGSDTLTGGRGDDLLDGGAGSDTYVVAGTAGSGFAGFDTWADSGTGTGEVDRLVAASGTAAVDIGLTTFSGLATGIEQIVGSTTTGAVRLLGDATANTLNFSGVTLTGANLSIDTGAGDDLVVGSAGVDRIIGGDGTDSLAGGGGDDILNGAGGSDTYLVSGTSASGFEGYDSVSDSGTGAGEVDRLVVAAGTAAVDIGLKAFSAAATGIEQIDATATTGSVRLLGDATANSFNFTGVSLLGPNLRIDVGAGNDTVVGSAGANLIAGGLGDDALNGAGGSDTYLVSGTSASGFEGYDSVSDSGTGAGEVDRLVVAAGTAAVDIGLKAFSAAATGIEQIDATATTGSVRLLGDATANSFNFTGVSLLGPNLRIDVGAGNDTVVGSTSADGFLAGLGNDSVHAGGGNDTLTGGGGLDTLTGGDGADTFVYTVLTDAITGGTTSAPTFERITDFMVGADQFDVSTPPPAGGFRNLGAVGFLTTSGIGTLLNATNFVANGAATFTYGSGTAQRTFIAFNNATAGYAATTDAIVELTNYTFAAGVTSLGQIAIA